VWRACGRQAAVGGFAAYAACINVTVTGHPALRFGTPHVVGASLRLSLHFTPVLRGRHATLKLTTLTVRCTNAGCTTVSGPATTRRLRLRAKTLTLTLALPDRDHGLQIDLRTTAFEFHGASWTAAHATSVFIRH
jgi:hypothetical protein